MALIQGTGTYQSPNYSNNISRHDFKHGYCFYVFDLKQQQDQHYRSEPKKGNARLELKFAEALQESVTAIVYAKFPATVEIDKSRRVTVQ